MKATRKQYEYLQIILDEVKNSNHPDYCIPHVDKSQDVAKFITTVTAAIESKRHTVASISKLIEEGKTLLSLHRFATANQAAYAQALLEKIKKSERAQGENTVAILENIDKFMVESNGMSHYVAQSIIGIAPIYL